MRAALWLLGLFAVAVALALFAGNNQGSITLFWPPYRVDLSLNLVLLLLLLLFVLLHLALRALAALFAMPGHAKRWHMQYQERALHQALLEALSHLVSGRFLRARKAAESVLARETVLQRHGELLDPARRLRALAHLLAAESAQALQDRPARQQHLQAALEQAAHSDAQEAREGVQLRAARWALEDRDAQEALRWIDLLPQGVARRTLALRLRLRAARMAGRTLLALETARLLAKHRAFSEAAGQGMVRSLALELLRGGHDVQQLQAAWSQLDAAERTLPQVALYAASRMLQLGGPAQIARDWLLPVWQQRADLGEPERVELVRVLEQSFAGQAGPPEADWLTRIEHEQLANPADTVLQYLAGMTCMRLQLWGKAQQLLRQAVLRLPDVALQRRAWVALAELAQRRDDAEAAAQAWRSAARADAE